jgi:hypothetical protein
MERPAKIERQSWTVRLFSFIDRTSATLNLVRGGCVAESGPALPLREDLENFARTGPGEIDAIRKFGAM